jgi:hypothetical protein
MNSGAVVEWPSLNTVLNGAGPLLAVSGSESLGSLNVAVNAKVVALATPPAAKVKAMASMVALGNNLMSLLFLVVNRRKREGGQASRSGDGLPAPPLIAVVQFAMTD